jgi:hypothetical protein
MEVPSTQRCSGFLITPRQENSSKLKSYVDDKNQILIRKKLKIILNPTRKKGALGFFALI